MSNTNILWAGSYLVIKVCAKSVVIIIGRFELVCIMPFVDIRSFR